MIRAKKILFDKLQKQNKEIPLKNIKKDMGSLAHAKGNPFFKGEITIQITTWIWQFGVGFIAPAALPPALQTNTFFNIFGLTDYYAGYPHVPTMVDCQPWLYAGSAIFGRDANIVSLVGTNIAVGDLFLQFAAPVPFGNMIQVNIHCNNIAYGTFLNSFVSDLIIVNQIRYFVPVANINQFINPLIFGYLSLFGKFSIDTVDPRMYQHPKEFQNQISDVPITFPVDKNLNVASKIDFDCQQITLVLFVEKVEPLIYKRNA